MLPAQDCGAPRLLCLLCAIIFLLLAPVMGVEAQTLASTTSIAVPAAVVKAAEAETGQVQLLVGRSTVLNVGVPIARVSLTRPEIADAVPTSPQQLLIHGKAAGAITMFVWDRAGGIKRYDVSVQRDLGELLTQMQQLFPGEPIKVSSNGKDLVISGTVSSKYVADKAADVAAGFVEKKDNVVNLLQLREGARSNQVLLRVRFAEVSRTALTELGASVFTSALGYKDWTGRATTQQFPAPTFDDKNGNPALIFSDYLNLFLFNNKEGLGTLIRALQNRGLFQSLAEPNLIAENGKEASFLAGGEYPYPAVQGNAATLAVTIVFKEFGIRLTFTPTILADDQVRLKVRPEVSTLDFTNAVSYQGFRIPSLTTRRAETEVELQNGQTFAIAGLMNNTMTSTMQKIPGIGDIPILGLLFRSKAAQKAQSELVVMITPQILPRGSTGVSDRLPGLIEPYLPPPPRTMPSPPPYPAPLPRDSQEQPATPPVEGRAPTPDTPAVAVGERAGTVASGLPAPASAENARPATGREAAPPAASAGTPASASPPATAVAAPPGSTPPVAAQSAAVPQQQQLVRPDKKALEREQKEIKKRLEAEATAQQKQEAEQRKLKEAEAKRAAEEARRQQKAAAEEAARQQKMAAEQARREAKAAAEEAERAEALAKVKQAKAEEERKQQEKLAREQAKCNAEAARKQAETDRKRAQQMREVEDRLKAAQAAYEAAVLKAKQGQK